MRRRVLLETGASTAVAGLAGCLESLWNGSSPSVRWQTDLPMSTGPVGDVVLDHGALYVETEEGVVALDPDDGERTWTFERRRLRGHYDGLVFAEGTNVDGEAGRVVAAVAAAGAVSWTAAGRYLHGEWPSVYLLDERTDDDASAEFPVLRALDPRDGHEQWTYQFDYPVTPFVRLHAPDNVYAVDTERGDPPTARVTCLNPAAAMVRWRKQVAPGTLPVTVWRHGRLFVGTERPDEEVDATVTALDADGTTRWQYRWDRPFAFPRWVRGPNLVVELGSAVGSDADRTTVMISEVNDEERWRTSGRFVGVREDLVAVFADDALVAVDRTNGEERHRVDVGDHIDTVGGEGEGPPRRSVTSAGQAVYVTAGRELVALDVVDGVRWTFEADRPLQVLGIVDGTVYGGTAETVYALDPP